MRLAVHTAVAVSTEKGNYIFISPDESGTLPNFPLDDIQVRNLAAAARLSRLSWCHQCFRSVNRWRIKNPNAVFKP